MERAGGPARWPCVAVLFFMTIPGVAVTLVALAALDRLGLWLHGRSGLPWYRDGHRAAPAPGLDELQAVLYSSTRHTIDQRRAELVLRDDEGAAAPAHVSVDLTRRRVVITRMPPSPAN
jgi:Family of unknown function (DUF6191)